MTRASRRLILGSAVIVGAVLLASWGGPACAMRDREPLRVAPRESELGTARVVHLGNLRVGRAPSSAEVELSRFLFGADPAPAIGFIKPIDVRVFGRDLVVCDTALGRVVTWRAAPGDVALANLSDPPDAPAAIFVEEDGGLWVADGGGGAVLGYDPAGRLRCRAALPAGEAFRPAGVARIDGEIWATNTAQHRVEVFDAATGRHMRAIGRRGAAPGEFGFPLGIAATGDGQVAVVDMLGCRVQMLDKQGRHQRDVGRPGFGMGELARPRGVAIGPDGVIFVTDSGAGCVQAYTAGGQPLGSFGGGGEDTALVLPAGIAIRTDRPPTEAVLDAEALRGGAPDYYVLVAEQAQRAGIRVFAWSNRPSEAASTDGVVSIADGPRPHRRGPHFRADGCTYCHTMQNGRAAPIPAGEVDRVCLSCHNGRLAPDEAHPVGRLAATAQTRAPADWPLVDGRLSCATCHEFGRHCQKGAQRPAGNYFFLRGHEDDGGVADFCGVCHSTPMQRVNPHRVSAESNAYCVLCHVARPELPGRAAGRKDSQLRKTGSGVCVGCHAPHADPRPGGHLGVSATPEVRANMRRADAVFGSRGGGEAATEFRAAESALLPLSDGAVACFSCHNPHAPGLFPADSILALRAANPADAAIDLRVDRMSLCIACHGK